MLKDAALLQLELLQDALAEGMILKDASSFNVQWIGSRPIFIDIPSFTRLVPGEPWVGYRQFCQLFLFPLFLQAYKDSPFQPWLRGSLDGISPQDCRQLMSARDLLRPGVFSHVYLQAKAQARYAESGQQPPQDKPNRQHNLKRDLRNAGFHTALIQANIRRLRKLIQRLSWQRSRSTWSDYTHHLPYTEGEQAQKADFVRRVTHARSWSMVWDLGCNTGTFSRIAAQNATTVVAMDVDTLVDRTVLPSDEERQGYQYSTLGQQSGRSGAKPRLAGHRAPSARPTRPTRPHSESGPDSSPGDRRQYSSRTNSSSG